MTGPTGARSRWWLTLVPADLAALVGIAVGSLLVRYGPAGQWPFPAGEYLRTVAVLAGAVVATGLLTGLYTRPRPLPQPPPVLPLAARTVFVAVAVLTMGDVVASPTWSRLQAAPAALRVLPYPTLNLLAFTVVAPLALASLRRVALWWQRRGAPPALVLFGTDVDVSTFLAASGADRSFTVASHTDDPDVLGGLLADADLLAVLDPHLLDGLPATLLHRCRALDVPIVVAVSPQAASVGVSRVVPVGAWPFVLLHLNGWPAHQLLAKGLLDRALTLLFAPVWVPLLVATAVWTRLAAGRPVLYRQRRVGQGGRPFDVVKFRTMRPDAERDGPQMACRGDVRVVPGMGWLRHTRLDELPQLCQVLTGRMSLVGPRPERDEFAGPAADRLPLYRLRHVVPPGVTGLAQVRGRYATDLHAKLGFDLVYLSNWSPVRDLEIVGRTIVVMLTRRL